MITTNKQMTAERKETLVNTLKYYQNQLDELRSAMVSICDQFDNDDYDLKEESENLSDSIKLISKIHFAEIFERIETDF